MQEIEALGIEPMQQLLGRIVRPARVRTRTLSKTSKDRFAVRMTTNMVTGPSAATSRCAAGQNAVGAVNGGCVVELLRNGLQAGYEQHHGETEALPYPDHGQSE